MLEKLKKEYAKLSEAALCAQAEMLYYIDEIARITVYGCDERETLLQECASFISKNLASIGELLGKATEARSSVLTAQACSYAAYFCKAVCEYSEEKGTPIAETELLQNAQAEETELGTTVAYVRNAVSDEAFKRFSGAIKNASVSYTASFAAACEEVYYGRVRYCILPYETSDEGTLSGFMKMIRKYELYTECICSVRGDRASTKFVLLSRQGGEPLNVKGAKRYLKVTVDNPDFYTYESLSVSASALNIRQIKSESVPVSWDDGRYGSVLTFEISAENAAPFLLYLSLCVPECSDSSVYVEI